MYINDLGMRDEAAVNANAAAAANVTDARSAASLNKDKSAASKISDTAKFPTAMEKAVESQLAAFGINSGDTVEIQEALERLQNDEELKDVGTALAALYKDQQQMQVQMSLLSAGYSSGLSTLSSQYGLGSLVSSAYGGTGSMLGSSIFGDMLL